MNETKFDLKKRVLCSDDACIGLVGPDGRCKVCGTAYTGDEPLPANQGDSEVTPYGATLKANQDAAAIPAEEERSSADDDVDERICCPDELCVGIIGKDGKCGICGKIM
jgi:hypothetical protein